MHTLDTRYDWVSTREAAARMNVSQSTVLRLIEDGKAVAEKVERPGGTRLLVRFDRPQDDATPTPEPLRPIESEATSEALQAASGAITALAAELAAERLKRDDDRNAAALKISGLYDQIAALSERAARAESDATHTSTRATDLAADLERERQRAAKAEAERDMLRAVLDRELARTWWDRLRGR